MLSNLVKAFKDIGIKPYIGIMISLECTEKTARSKLKGESPILLSEAISIKEKYFKNKKCKIEDLFKDDLCI